MGSALLQSVAAVVLRGGEVLVVRHALRRLLELPGGRVGGLWAPGVVESDAEALARLLLKESGLTLRAVRCCLGTDANEDWECRYYLCECEGDPAPGVGTTEAFFSGAEILRAGMWSADETMAHEALGRVALGAFGSALGLGAVKRARQAARRRVLEEEQRLRANAGRVATRPPPCSDPPPPDPEGLAQVARMNDALAMLRLRGALGHFRPEPAPHRPHPFPAEGLRACAIPLPDFPSLPPPAPRRGRPVGGLAMAALMALASMDADASPEALGRSEGSSRRWSQVAPWLVDERRARARRRLRAMASVLGEVVPVLCLVRPREGVARWEGLKAHGLIASDEEGDGLSGVVATADMLDLMEAARAEGMAILAAPVDAGSFLAPPRVMACEVMGSILSLFWITVPSSDEADTGEVTA